MMSKSEGISTTKDHNDKTLECSSLLESVEETINLLNRTSTILENFHEDSQEEVFDNLAKLIKAYKRVDERRNVFGEHKIPMELIEHLDREDCKNNPALLTKLKVSTCLEEEERVNKYRKCFHAALEGLNPQDDDTNDESSKQKEEE